MGVFLIYACRVEAGQTYAQSYNVENRMSTVLLVSGTLNPNVSVQDYKKKLGNEMWQLSCRKWSISVFY